ncbi:MAG: PAS domain-containing hybrid sensor histidine kinase/response regulator [Bacteroidales bacterium]
MKFLEKTKEELIEALQTIHQEHDDLKLLYEKDITSLRNAEEKLKLSEERQREVLENSVVAAYKRNLRTNGYEYLSPVFIRLTGYTPKEMKTLPLETVFGLIHPDDMPEVERTIAEAISKGTGQTNQVEYRFRHKEGEYRWFIDRFTLVNDSQAKPVALIGSISDITERKQVEGALVETKVFLDSIIENSPNSMWISDEYGTLMRLNQACRDNLHLKDDEVIGKYNIFEDNLLEEQGFMPMVKDVFKKGVTAHFTIQYDTSALKNINLEQTIKVFIEVHISSILNSQGKVTNAIIQHNDITQRRMAEHTLIESEEKYRVLLNGSPYGILATDIETHQFLFSNAAICKLFGYTDEEFQRVSVENLVPKECFDLVMREFDSQMRGDKSVSVDQTCIRKDGTIFYADIASASIIINGRKCSVGFFTDVTERKQAQESLMESQLRYQKLFDLANEGLILLSKDGKLVEVNKAFAEMHGYTVNELKNIDIRDLDVLSEAAFEDRADIMQRIDAGEVVRFEVDHYHKDGHIITFSDSASLINIGDQQYYLAFHQDITDRKLAEEFLKESESSLNEAQNIGKIGSWQLDLINNKVKWSKNCFVIYGLEPYEIEPSFEYFKSRVHPDDLHIIDESFENISKFKEPNNTEIRILLPDGNFKWLQNNMVPIVIEDKLVALKGIHIDITDRKQAEEKLHEKNVQFRKLSANLPDLIFQFTRRPNGSYYVPIASEGIKNIFGCSPEDVIEDFAPIGSVIYPEDSERVISDIEHSAKHLTYFTCEFRVQIPGKPIQWIFSRSTPEKLADGSITWYGFNANITEMKQTEFDLITAKEHAEESDRLKSAFLANMSHEIRTPMNGILGFAQLLREPNLTGEEQQEYIRIIEKSGKRMLNIINDIVNISKIESGQTDIFISETNINEQIEFMHEFFTPEIRKKGLQFVYKTTLPPKESIINTDREKIYAILTNLVSNAIKYTNTGSVEFGYEKKGKYLEFYVKDTGIGVSKDQEAIIFERFRQGDDLTKQFTEGTGLGLSIAKGFVELLGGKIWLKSELGQGTTFYFTIPCDVEEEVNPAIKNSSANKNADHQVKNLKILVVEDDEDWVSLLSKALKLFYREMLTARTGVEAVEACRNNPDLDLVLMDIRMPELDGYSATRQIRQFNQDVIIIAQTAFGLTGDSEKAIEAGCNDHISKPINIDELGSVMQKHFGKQR